MKTVTFTDFRNKASDFMTEVEHGQTLVVLRRGKPVAEIIPFTDTPRKEASWKQPRIRLQLRGADLSSAIVDEREQGQ